MNHYNVLTLIMYSMRLWECFSITDSIQISGFTWWGKHVHSWRFCFDSHENLSTLKT